MHYFYGARAIDEVFFLEDFLELEKEFPNFHFHLALDRPDPKADALGVKYTPGFIAPVMGDTYLKQHDAPEDIEYYLCGPPMMSKTVLDLLRYSFIPNGARGQTLSFSWELSRRGTHNKWGPRKFLIFGEKRKCGKPNSCASFFLQATSDEVLL